MSLQTQIHSLVERLAERFSLVDGRIGGLEQLDTSAKVSLVTAINELAARSGTGTAAYTHVQTVASALWTINHNLGTRPAVSILDTGGHEVEADVAHNNVNQLVIRFAIPMAGLARLT